ncbi:MAG TPA: hypothetical protein VMA09_11160 [Candidatus Binataceae bacterium]|nr:hypothetical protein [Candidatus Binataceae bacterium]
METISNPLAMPQVATTATTTEVSEAQRFNQRRSLEEVPGAIFAGLTLTWIVASLLNLM